MRAERIDFLRRPGQPVLGGWLLAAGVLALGAALWQLQRWDATRELRLAAIAEREAAARERTEAARPVPPTAAELRLRQAQREIQRPWLATLRGIEQATQPPVYLLSMAIDPNSGAVRLEAEASDFEQGVAYAQRLAATGALEAGTLTTHETVMDPANGRRSVRFSVTTRWVR